jgi:hypothetical protein
MISSCEKNRLIAGADFKRKHFDVKWWGISEADLTVPLDRSAGATKALAALLANERCRSMVPVQLRLDKNVVAFKTATHPRSERLL